MKRVGALLAICLAILTSWDVFAVDVGKVGYWQNSRLYIPSASFIFLNTGLPANVSFTRATPGGVWTANGTYQTVGNDQPRFDYYPGTSIPRGLLIEGQRTNLLLWNRDLTNAVWTKTNVTVAKSATGLDGVANSASRLTATANNGTVLQAVTSGSAARATTAYVRRVSGTGTVEMTQNGGTNWTAVTVTSDWTRVGPASATITNPSVGFRLGTSGDVIEVDYVQLESASFASSAILTTTAAATRAADIAGIPSLPTIGFNPGEGTMVAEFEDFGTDSMTFPAIWEFNDGTFNNRILLGLRESTRMSRFAVNRNGGIDLTLDYSSFAENTVVRMAAAYAPANYGVSTNGGPVVTSTSAATPPTSFNVALIGRNRSGHYQYAWIRRLIYFPVWLPGTTLQYLAQ